MKKLEFIFIDLEKQKPTKIKSSYIELYDKHFEYVGIFRAEEPENNEEPHLGEWKEHITNLIIYGAKDKISGLERSYIEKTGIWAIYIIMTGFNQDVKIYFKEEKEANEFLNELKIWWLS